MNDKVSFSSSGDLSRKVISIAAGESHTIALTGDGNVYTWGRGMFGRLGTGSESDEISPVKISFDFPDQSERLMPKIVGVAAGAYHSLALADDGSVWSWGYNAYGQLGFDGENSLVPHIVDCFRGSETASPLKLCYVKAGGMMSLAIDMLGSLWMWGNIPNHTGETEADFVLTSVSTPTSLQDFHGKTVVKVACGNEHVVALVGTGETVKANEDLVLYSWGNNSHGQLGLGDRETRVRPHVVETFSQDSDWRIYEIACGASHTAVLARKKAGSDETSSCWTFGCGDNGQLGHGNTQSSLVPKSVVELPQNLHLVSLDCGLFHTSVVFSNGEVWSWGMVKGLGLCPDAGFSGEEAGDAISPLPINRLSNGPKFHDPVQIACGAAHTVLVAHDGYKLWSWGRGRSGLLGVGNEIDHYTPTPVLWPQQVQDTKQDEPKLVDEDEEKKITETDKRLSEAMEEIKSLQSKISVMERYVGVLHSSVFGKPFDEREDIPASLRNNQGYFDVGKEWETMLESSDRSRLLRLEGFYRSLLAGVKDKLLQKRVQELLKDCVRSQTP